MKLALIGATGRVGSRILAEVISRGHQVRAIARQIVSLKPTPQLIVKTDDASKSTVSMEDFPIALVDELEHPQHICQRFTAGY